MDTLRSGIIGTGFMGHVHTHAVRAAGGHVQAIAVRDPQRSRAISEQLRIPQVKDPYELIASPDIDLVHICTPNDSHVEYVLAATAAGKHVICEKPLALTVKEASRLNRAAREAGVINAVPFVYRYYASVREARARISRADDRVWLIHGHYLQDWLSDRNDYNWRIDEGSSRAFADIGVHWCDLIEFVTGHRITELAARTTRLHETRNSPHGEVRVDSEDAVTLMFQTDRGANGTLVVSQASPGRKNALRFSVDAGTSSYAFDQESPDLLWVGGKRFNTLVPKGGETLESEAARDYVTLPSGHPQGYQDCFNLFLRDVHRAIRGEIVESLPTFEDGVRAAQLTDTVVASGTRNQWTEVEERTSRRSMR